MINRLKYLYAILYTVTSLGPQNWVIKKFDAPKITRQLVICIIKNPIPLPITCLPIFQLKNLNPGFSSGYL